MESIRSMLEEDEPQPRDPWAVVKVVGFLMLVGLGLAAMFF